MKLAAQSGSPAEAAAVSDFAGRWVEAMTCLYEAGGPARWQRVQNALFCFKGMRLDHLNPSSQRRLDQALVQVNHVLAKYDLKEWSDYRKIADADLARIEEFIRNIML